MSKGLLYSHRTSKHCSFDLYQGLNSSNKWMRGPDAEGELEADDGAPQWLDLSAETCWYTFQFQLSRSLQGPALPPASEEGLCLRPRGRPLGRRMGCMSCRATRASGLAVAATRWGTGRAASAGALGGPWRCPVGFQHQTMWSQHLVVST